MLINRKPLTVRVPSGRSTRFCGKDVQRNGCTHQEPKNLANPLFPHPHHLPLAVACSISLAPAYGPGLAHSAAPALPPQTLRWFAEGKAKRATRLSAGGSKKRGGFLPRRKRPAPFGAGLSYAFGICLSMRFGVNQAPRSVTTSSAFFTVIAVMEAPPAGMSLRFRTTVQEAGTAATAAEPAEV